MKQRNLHIAPKHKAPISLVVHGEARVSPAKSLESRPQSYRLVGLRTSRIVTTRSQVAMRIETKATIEEPLNFINVSVLFYK